MPVWLTTVDGKRHRAKTRDGDDDAAAQRIVDALERPYSKGWVELESDSAAFVQLRHVVAIYVAGVDEPMVAWA
jgi:hypothetical protein